MSATTLVTVQCVSGEFPSVLDLDGKQYTPIGGTALPTFQVPAVYLGRLLSSGYSIVVTGGTTHVP